MNLKPFFKHLNLVISSALVALTLSSCSSYYFDSSIGPQGATLPQKEAVKTSPKKTAQKSVKKANKTAQTQVSNVSTKLKAGQIKPYIPDENLSQSSMVLLPSIEKNESSKEVAIPYALESEQNSKLATNLKEKVEPVKLEGDKLEDSKSSLVDTKEQEQEQVQEVKAQLDKPSAIVIANDADTLSSQDKSKTLEKCGEINTEHAREVAFSVASNQATRLKGETGSIYISRTVVPNNLSDCIGDLSAGIYEGLQGSGLNTLKDQNMGIYQNQGSNAMIPTLIKACKQNGIDILNVSTIRKIGSNTVITIRNIRVKDGITLVQNTTSL